MTTCGLLPLLQHLLRHCHSLCCALGMPRTAGCSTGRQESSVGKQRGAGRLGQEGWDCREGFSAELALSLLPAAQDGWGVQAGLQPLPQPEHHIHILVTVFGHLCFSWQCQSSRTAGKRGKWTSLAMSLLLQLSQRSVLVVLSHVCSKQS